MKGILSQLAAIATTITALLATFPTTTTTTTTIVSFFVSLSSSSSCVASALTLTTPVMTTKMTFISHDNSMSVVVVGLNAALQKRFVVTTSDENPMVASTLTSTTGSVSRLIPGEVHRASHVSVGIGGKGQNVAMTLQCLYHPSSTSFSSSSLAEVSSSADVSSSSSSSSFPPRVYLAQFLGSGPEGDTVHQMLQKRWRVGNYQEEEVHDDNDDDHASRSSSSSSNMALTIRTASSLRTCTSIVTDLETTELIEPSGWVTPTEWQGLLDTVTTHRNGLVVRVPDSTAVASKSTTGSVATAIGCPPALCFAGSLPPGCPKDAYAQLYDTIVLAAATTTTTTTAPSATTTTSTSPEDDTGAGTITDHGNEHDSGPATSPRIPLPLCLIDSVAGLEPLFQRIGTATAAATTPTTTTTTTMGMVDPNTILKINVSELCRLVNMCSSTGTTESTNGGVSSDILVQKALTRFLQQTNSWVSNNTTTTAITAIALTDGRHPAYLAIVKQQQSTRRDVERINHNNNNNNNSIDEVSSSFDLYRLPIASLTSLLGGSTTATTSPMVVDNTDFSTNPTTTPTATLLTATPTTATTTTATGSSRTTVYPIGAGDATAAGTLAAWLYLYHQRRQHCTTRTMDDNNNNEQESDHSNRSYSLPASIAAALDARYRSFWDWDNNTNAQSLNDPTSSFKQTTAMLWTAFGFGLACGSASCLEVENSVVHIPNVLLLFDAAERQPTLVDPLDTL